MAVGDNTGKELDQDRWEMDWWGDWGPRSYKCRGHSIYILLAPEDRRLILKTDDLSCPCGSLDSIIQTISFQPSRFPVHEFPIELLPISLLVLWNN
ncbi:hypothetical protein OsI_36772 [Oryza sativa Indica Group]|uniref:Uncharacterized protein n=1 Tax=Oryza sativa subsp. indica TaxID=39946 RepID=A2ZG69_ORYSI|nr:hypothetical protein OsI_36772 [Oryza sativa Indica Group]